ncbi:uncharacterized protein LOC113381828, partial [Ctenocephalides felis]|uniref:uncharacterized protein LOC113381828 n=1 Tax=Ctenocephalides felis TaxID=7515 RepID=UPI000E6E3024
RRNLFRRKQSTSTTVSQETTTALSNNVASPTEAPPRKVQFRKRLPTTSIVPETTVIPQVSVTPPAITLTTPVHDQQALTSLREAESIEDSESDIRKQKLRPDDTLDNY